MLEKTEAGSSVLSSKSDAFFFERSASFVEAVKLLFVEIEILGKSHHRSLDLDGLAAAEIANERCSVLIGPPTRPMPVSMQMCNGMGFCILAAILSSAGPRKV